MPQIPQSSKFLLASWDVSKNSILRVNKTIVLINPATSMMTKLRKLQWAAHVKRMDNKQCLTGYSKAHPKDAAQWENHANGDRTQWRRPVKSYWNFPTGGRDWRIKMPGGSISRRPRAEGYLFITLWWWMEGWMSHYYWRNKFTTYL